MIPAANPDKIRPKMRENTKKGSAEVAGGERSLAAAINNQPMIDGIEEISSVVRRPRLVSIGPTTRLPTSAPKLIILEKKATNPSPISNWAETDEENPRAIPAESDTCCYFYITSLTTSERTD